MPRLMIVIASTRPNRVGPCVAEWFQEHAQRHGSFDVEVVDLAELALPFFDEPHHPRLGRYTQLHTQQWSRMVEAVDAVVFVMPEYNYGYTAPLKNAIDYLHREWAYKPVGFVSYGGMAGGTRAVQALKPVVVALRMTPAFEAIAIPFVHKSIDSHGHYRAPEDVEHGVRPMLDELLRLTEALRPLCEREPVAV
ncbi:MAG: NAD(P)H-dependent oxidoreductase [Gemmatimonadaceae bacterium]